MSREEIIEAVRAKIAPTMESLVRDVEEALLAARISEDEIDHNLINRILEVRKSPKEWVERLYMRPTSALDHPPFV